MQWAQTQRADALIADAQKEPDLGLAELVDRLHGIADHKERAPLPLLPADGQRLQKRKLAKGNVLKLIDQNVLKGKPGPQRKIGRLALLGERLARGARDIRMVDASGEGKFELQVRCRPAQHARQCVEHPGILSIELGRRHTCNLLQHLMQPRYAAQAIDRTRERLTLRRHGAGDFPPRALVGEHESNQALPGG